MSSDMPESVSEVQPQEQEQQEQEQVQEDMPLLESEPPVKEVQDDDDEDECEEEYEYDEEPEDEESEEEPQSLYDVSSKLKFNIVNRSGKKLSFTVFDKDDDKKVRIKVSSPMTLSLKTLQEYVNGLDTEDDYEEQPNFMMHLAVFMVVLLCFAVLMQAIDLYIKQKP